MDICVSNYWFMLSICLNVVFVWVFSWIIWNKRKEIKEMIFGKSKETDWGTEWRP